MNLKEANKILGQIRFADDKYAIIRVNIEMDEDIQEDDLFLADLEAAGFEYDIQRANRLDIPWEALVVTTLKAPESPDQITNEERISLAQAWLDRREILRKIGKDFGYEDWVLPLI